MKKYILTLLAVVFAASSLFSQGKGKGQKTPEEIAAKRAANLQKELSLTDEQKTKVEAAIKERITKVREIKAKYPNDKKGMGKEIKPINEKFQADMKSILTAEQYVKYEAKVNEAKKKAKEKRQGKGKGKNQPATSGEDDVDTEE